MRIPDQLSHLRVEPGGVAWLAQLPELVRGRADAWSLRVGEPYAYAFVSLALRAELPGGTPVVLKSIAAMSCAPSASPGSRSSLKPVLAEREFDTAALIRDGDGDVRWLELLSSELGLDRERMRRWALIPSRGRSTRAIPKRVRSTSFAASVSQGRRRRTRSPRESRAIVDITSRAHRA